MEALPRTSLRRDRLSANRALSAALLVGFPLAKLLVHLAVGAGYGYHRDELYYLACAEHLAWGYVDQPPFAVLVMAITRAIAGDSVAVLRVVPAVAGALTVLTIGLITRRLGGRALAQTLAMAAALACPFYLALDSYFSMNAFDLLAWSVAAWLLIAILQGGSERLWVWLGVVLGVGLENKISVLWLGFGIVIGLLMSRQRSLLRTRGPWLAAAIALALFIPHILWQILHRLPTLEFMRNATAGKLASHTVEMFVRGQLDGTLWVVAPIWIAGLVFYLWLDAGHEVRPLGWTWLAVFCLLVLTRTSRAAYLAPAYTWLLPAGGVVLERVAGRSPLGLAAAFVYLVLIADAGRSAAPFVIPLVPEPALAARVATAGPQAQEEKDGRSALPEFLSHMDGWPEIVESIARVFDALPDAEKTHAAILAPDYGIASAIDLFGRRRGLPPALSAHNNYWFWGLRGQEPATFIIVGYTPTELQRWFQDFRRVSETTCNYCMDYDNHQPIWIARGLQLPADQWWGQLQNFE